MTSRFIARPRIVAACAALLATVLVAGCSDGTTEPTRTLKPTASSRDYVGDGSFGINGPNWLPSNSTNTYTIGGSFCASGCTIQVVREFNNADSEDYGTYSTTSTIAVDVPWTGNGNGSLYAVATNGSGTASRRHLVAEQENEGGGPCAPDVIICR